MRNFAKFFAVAGCLPAILYSQPARGRKSFEVVSVKHADGPTSVYEETPGRIRYRCSLWSLVQRAYGVTTYDLENTGVLPSDLYEIAATLPQGAGKEDIPAMLRSLLEDRFRFSSHWVEKPMAVDKLTVDPAGLKLQLHHENGDKPVTDPPFMAQGGNGPAKFSGAATIQKLAEFLQSGLGHPVIDGTGVDGVFDIVLDTRFPPIEVDRTALTNLPLFQGRTPADPDAPVDITIRGMTIHGDAPEIGTALKKLGLRLDKGRGNVRVLVVDSVNKTPTPN